jgi:putative ABC transport system permease protein
MNDETRPLADRPSAMKAAAESFGAMWRDVSVAWRSLWRRPGFMVAAVATLAMGIGANAALFSAVDAVLLRPLPFKHPEGLVSLSGNSLGSSLGEYVQIRNLSRSLAQLGCSIGSSVTLTGRGQPEALDAASVSVNLFSLLGVSPAVGRAFARGEDTPGNDRVVILSDGLWADRFARDPRIIGHALTVDGVARTVVGIMPPGFQYPSAGTRIWMPIALDVSNQGALWGNGGYRFIGRLAPGATAAQAQSELRRVALQVRHVNPVWDPGPAYGKDAQVISLRQGMVDAARPMLLILFGVVSFVLLIACANVTNLQLVRATSRETELAVRAALGADRRRLVRLLLVESLLLAALGGVTGLLIAWWSEPALVALLPAGTPRVSEVAIDVRVLGYAACLVLVTGLAFGLLPALRATGLHLQTRLQSGGRASSQRAGHQRVTGLLVAGEIALAVMLVSAAGVLTRSFDQLRRVDPGFRGDGVVAAVVYPPERRYADSARVIAFYSAVLDRVAALPGVQDAAATSHLPLGDANYGIALRIEGQAEDLRHTLPSADHYQVVTPGYLRTMGIRLLHGRGLTDMDRAGAPGVVVVSASMAAHFWPGQDPLGKRVGYPYPSDWLTIVGVVADIKQDSLNGMGEMTLYRPFLQAPATSMTIVARAADPDAVARPLQSAVWAVDRDVPLGDVRTFGAVVSRALAIHRFAMLLVAGFAALALALGACGIYGVVSYAVSQHTRDIGIRIALGASPRGALRSVLAPGAAFAATGLASGLFGAAVIGRVLTRYLYGVSPTDPLTLSLVVIVLATVAALATYIPARRATRISPATALRGE